ncbi:MAG: DUF4388 domain-containing protein, partial [Deltaproteobacteria bacterium]|nr:DUF4388 domain-containing protein [Deltaproteobacteria bacterium]
RTGTLVIQGPASRRRVVFRDGQVVFASSTELSERLGPVLWRHGMVTLERLQECEPQVTPTAKLGKVLMDAKLLTAAQLYRGMQMQVKEIVLGAFVETEGEFAFVDEGDNPELNTVRLLERTRDVVLEGMSRSEEMVFLRQLFDLAGAPKRLEGPVPTVMEQDAVWQKVDGRLTVRDIIRSSRLGEFAALKALRDLAAAGRIQPPPPGLPRAPLSRQQTSRAQASSSSALQLYRSAVDRIRGTLGLEANGRLASYVEALAPAQQALFEGVHVAEGPDFDRLLQNAQKRHPGAMARAVAQEAADGLVAFALFEARNLLPTGRAAELSREVGKILKGK